MSSLIIVLEYSKFYTLCILYIDLESSSQNTEKDVAGISTSLGAKKSLKKRNGKIS